MSSSRRSLAVAMALATLACVTGSLGSLGVHASSAPSDSSASSRSVAPPTPPPAPPPESEPEADAADVGDPESAADPATTVENAPETGATPGVADAVDAVDAGQVEGTDVDRGFFAAIAEAGAGTDDAIRVGEDELEDTLYLLRASLLWFQRPSERSEISVAYEPEVERFADHDELDAVTHAAGLLVEYAVDRHSRLSVGGSYLDGEDPGRHLGGFLLVLPRSPFSQRRAYAGFERRFRHGGLQVRLGRTETRIEPVPIGPEGTPAFGLDQTDDSILVGGDRDLGARTALIASYSYLRPSDDGTVSGPDGLPIAPQVEPLHAVTVGLRFDPRPELVLHVAAGALDDGERTDWVGSAGIERRGERSTVRFAYDRSASALGVGGPTTTGADGPAPGTALVRDALTDTASLGFTVHFVERFEWEQLLWAARTRIAGGEPIESLAASARLVTQIAEHLGVYAAAEYLEQRGETSSPLDRLRWTAGLRIGFGGPPDEPGVLRPSPRLARVLPQGRGD